MVFILVLTWFTFGMYALVRCWRSLHIDADREQTLKHLRETAEEFKMPEYDVIALVYLLSFMAGFIVVPITVYKKFTKKDK